MNRSRRARPLASITAVAVLVTGCYGGATPRSSQEQRGPVRERQRPPAQPAEPPQDEVVGVWQPLPRCGPAAGHVGDIQVDDQMEFWADGTVIIGDTVTTWRRVDETRIHVATGWVTVTVEPTGRHLILDDDGQVCTFYAQRRGCRRPHQHSLEGRSD